MCAALVVTFFVRIGFVSTMGIVCGWQPMPDGIQSYECVVQVEPQLLDALKRGDSIPLSVEVPEHVRPISRIRLVVGDGNVPQTLLAQAPKKSLHGVVQTQFTTSNNSDSQYNNQAHGTQVIPASEYVTNAQDAFARSLQNGGKEVRNSLAEVARDILPPDAGRSMVGAMEQAGQELGTNLRNTGATVREDIRQLFGTESAVENRSEILPPDGQRSPQYPSRPSEQTQQILPANPSAENNRRRLDQPINSNQFGDWQSRPTGEVAAAIDVNRDANRVAPPYSVSDTTVLPRNDSTQAASQANNRDTRYGDYSPSQNSTNSATASRQTESENNHSAPSGLAFPPFTPTAGDQSVTPTPQSPSSVAEIRRDMLDRPANAEIQAANGMPIGQQPAGQAAIAPAATDFNWNTKLQTQPATAQSLASQTPTGPVFPLLLSWVLLSGSGAGNLYLFWSYLDVRYKYQDLLGESPRRPGSRRRIRD